MQFLFGDSLSLMEGPSITLGSTFLFRSTPNAEVERGEIPVADSSVMRLIGKQITQAVGIADGTLGLVFEDGAAIEFLDDNPHYECYQIRGNGGLVIV